MNRAFGALVLLSVAYPLLLLGFALENRRWRNQYGEWKWAPGLRWWPPKDET